MFEQGIDDLCLKYFVEAGAIAVRRVKKEDLRRIAKATGGKIVTTLADMEGNETFDATVLGEAEEVGILFPVYTVYCRWAKLRAYCVISRVRGLVCVVA